MIKERYSGIDITKLFLAYMVALQHVVLAYLDDGIFMKFVAYTVNIAVPYFFMASGFFMMKKIDSNEENKKTYMRKHILNITKLYVIWTGVLLIFRIPAVIRMGLDFDKQISYWLNYFRSVLFVGEYQLWYLLGLIQIMIIFYFLYKKSIATCLIISIVAYGIKLIGTYAFWIIESNDIILTIYNFYDIFCEKFKNGIFSGFIYFMLGCYISKIDIKESKKYIAGILAVPFVIIGYVSYLSGIKYVSELLCLIAVVLLFVFTLLMKDIKSTVLFRNLSSYIYVSHIAIMLAWQQIKYGMGVILEWILVCVLATISGLIVIGLSKRIKLLKQIY